MYPGNGRREAALSYRLVTLRSFYSAVPKIVILGPPASGKTTIVSASRHVCDTEAAPRRLPSQLSFSSLPSPASNLFSYCKRQCVFIVENLENTKKKTQKKLKPRSIYNSPAEWRRASLRRVGLCLPGRARGYGTPAAHLSAAPSSSARWARWSDRAPGPQDSGTEPSGSLLTF